MQPEPQPAVWEEPEEGLQRDTLYIGTHQGLPLTAKGSHVRGLCKPHTTNHMRVLTASWRSHTLISPAGPETTLEYRLALPWFLLYSEGNISHHLVSQWDMRAREADGMEHEPVQMFSGPGSEMDWTDDIQPALYTERAGEACGVGAH